MSSQPFVSAPPAPPVQPRVRWTLADLVLTGLLTIGLSAALLLVLALPGLFGLTLVRDLLNDRPLVLSMIIGGTIYLLAVVATYIVIVRRRRSSWREIGFRMPPLLALLLTPLLFFGQLLVLMVVNVILMTLIGEFENPQIAALTDPRGFSWLNFAFVFIVGAIIAPIVEEIVFRGLLYQWLRTHTSAVAAIVVSGMIFSLVHIYPVVLLPLFAVGVILAAVFEWTKSLWITIVLHFFQNAMAISVFFLLQAYPNLVPQT
ncbi:MAG TPA: CPBP family intramembrane glutamic endopeptidase [Herpetosiphonaceae bacterium]